MALEDLNPEVLRDTLLKAARRTDGSSAVEEDLIREVVSYCATQFTDLSVRTNLNYEEYRLLAREAVSGLYFLIYIKYYRDGENLLEKESFYISSQNYLLMMYRSVLGGQFAKTIIAENQSRVAPNMIVGGR